VKWFSAILGLLLIVSLAAAQEGGGSLNWDINSIFDEISPESPSPPPSPPKQSTDTTDTTESQAADAGRPDLVRRQGVSFDGSYEFALGFAPGWAIAPWFSPREFSAKDNGFSWDPFVKMRVTFDVDAQISDVFRVISQIYFEIPGLTLKLGDVYFDYSLYDKIFVRGGKYNYSWGISPNFAFTNLLARVPDASYNRDPFILKFDVPLGIGGFQLLGLTRVDLISGVTPERRDIGYGGKFNLASRWLDLDIGTFYQEGMPMRGFLSLKTTLGNTELYNEWLGAINVDKPAEISGAINLGFMQDFFSSRLSLNGELFYNAEKNTLWYRPETNIYDSQTYLFVEGLNVAMNVIWRIGGKGNPRLFIQTLYAPTQESAQLVPGFRLSPWNHVELYFAIPMGLGSKDGFYYNNTADFRGNRPFSIVMLLTLKGDVRIGQYSP